MEICVGLKLILSAEAGKRKEIFSLHLPASAVKKIGII